MSLDTTGNLKQQLMNNLGPKYPIYHDALQKFATGRISRSEFEDIVNSVLTTSTLLQIHNALIISLFDATAAYKRSAAAAAAVPQSHDATATPTPPSIPKAPLRKRKRTLLPYQGPDVSEDDRSLKSMRLKKWVLAMGKKERDRLKTLPNSAVNPSSQSGAQQASTTPMVVEGQPPAPPPPIVAQSHLSLPPTNSGRPRPDLDEVSSERGVRLLPERGGQPGVRLPIHLHSSTRAPTVQHIADRINLICAQHNLSLPSRAVASLLNLACEAKLKQLITHALTLTLSSQAISSISPASATANPFIPASISSSSRDPTSNAQTSQSLTTLPSSSTLHHIPQKTPVLTASAFQTLFTMYPSSLPNKSAVAMRLATIPSAVDDDTDDIPVLKDREVRDQRWQIMALLAERSAVRESLKSVSTFLNEHASPLLLYFQQPGLAEINNGQLLQSLLLKIVNPPIFWNAFQQAFRDDELSIDGQKAFGWLLLQLLSLPPDFSALYNETPNLSRHLARFLTSNDIDLRTLGHKIKHATESQAALNRGTSTFTAGFTPGGRHDNDFADFRDIAIVPTPDEIQSKEPAFIRPSDFLRDPSTKSNRVATHIDNQFRLLREDMLYELREELQMALGSQKRRRATKIAGLQVVGLYLHETQPRGKHVRRVRCGLQLECAEDLDIFRGVNPRRRARHIQDETDFLRHQSLACLQSDNEIIAFVTIYRDPTLLAHPDQPIIAVQLEGNEGMLKILQKIKKRGALTLVQIDTALFAYEFVLKALQRRRTLPLSEELLLWNPDSDVPEELSFLEVATPVAHALMSDHRCDLKPLLGLKEEVQLDASQTEALIAGLTQRVSLIQGPPGTGKSYIGALMAKSIHDYTRQTILIICFTNHALDDILTGLLDIGIPASSMVRLGGKSTPRTEPLTLQRQGGVKYRRSQSEWQAINMANSQLGYLEGEVTLKFDEYMADRITHKDILRHLRYEDSDYHFAFTIPNGEEGMEFIGNSGRAIKTTYLIDRWLNGQDGGIFRTSDNVQSMRSRGIWGMDRAKRKAKSQEWYHALETKQVRPLHSIIKSYNEWTEKLKRAFEYKDVDLIKGKRIIGCTTTAAAKYGLTIQAIAPDVVLVEEAGEILESHILTALGPGLKQLILIGDHKQLRPKVKNYELTVEKGNGYDLNCSLFERLILSGYPHQTLTKQHRMRPEISDLIRQLTYPELQDAPRTQNRPNITGVQDNIVFITHSHPESTHGQLADGGDMATNTSRQNQFEVEIILKIVKYLGQQGYGTDNLVVLTPYLGQLHLLRDALKKDNDPLLGDLDSHDLVKAGLLDLNTAQKNKKPIRLSTIDNYQGEESDIVVISLTRSNDAGDIGFMYSPERLNVLLSRARNGLIMVGNSTTFKKSRKGKELWSKLFNMLINGGHMYEGLPVYCAQHPDRREIIHKPEDFDVKCPDGGCSEPCNAILNCLVHKCAARCHNLADHSKVPCQEEVRGTSCKTCQREARQKQQAELEEKQRQEAAERGYLRMADVNAEIAKEHHRKREAERAAEMSTPAVSLWRKRADQAALMVKAPLTTFHPSSMCEHHLANVGEPSLPRACKICERETRLARQMQQVEEQDQQEELIALNTLRLQALKIIETGGPKFTTL
ncbi:hypothetical protein MD484_g924, partial [Candolleomyces efflorescens]